MDSRELFELIEKLELEFTILIDLKENQTEDAEIVVQVRTDEDSVIFEVSDNGIGIPEELRSKIFEPFADFHSAEHHTSEEPDSAGLGLYVARGLIDEVLSLDLRRVPGALRFELSRRQEQLRLRGAS